MENSQYILLKYLQASLRFNILPCEKENKINGCFLSASNLGREKLKCLSFQNIPEC
jgi:hypothetical protein